jgi:hypothetical protein
VTEKATYFARVLARNKANGRHLVDNHGVDVPGHEGHDGHVVDVA